MNIIKLFLVWRIWLFIVAALAIFFLPQFANTFPYYREQLISTGLPNWLWGFGNFDGVHYLVIARQGYSAQYTQAFFPLYPLLIAVVNNIVNSYFWSAIIISNLCLLGFLIVFYKLMLHDMYQSSRIKVLILLLSFPTAFYFISIYTEALFVFLATLSVLLMRKQKYLLAGLLAALASATRLVGVFLLIIYVIEIYQAYRDKELKSWLSISKVLGFLLIPLGTVLYMFYLQINFNDPLYFLDAQPAFGASRSSSVVLLPQVIFRYFKIFMSVPIISLPFFHAAVEFVFTLVGGLILLATFKRIRLSYWLFSLCCFLLPTLSGTFSSMPRYLLSLFLLFPVITLITRKYYLVVAITSLAIQALFLIMFIRGYWVA